MRAASTVVSILAISQQTAAVVDRWTPADFDWNSQNVRYDVATQNMTSSRVPTKEMVLFAADNHNITESNLVLHEALVIGFSVAATLRVIGWLTTAAGLVSTGLGCYEVIEGAVGGEQTTAKSKASCVLGIASSALGFGGKSLPFPNMMVVANQRKLLELQNISKPRKHLLQLELPPFRHHFHLRTWGPTSPKASSWLVWITLNGLSKRHLPAWRSALIGRGLTDYGEWDQYFHNDFTANMIRDLNFGEPEFLGYANEKHQLSKRDGVHAFAPRFKFEHPKHGPMVLSTRFTNTTSHITVEPFVVGNAKIHKRYQEQYEKEVLEDNKLLEARFDHEAADADPAAGDITLDEVNVFSMAEDSLHCALSGNTDDGWPLDQVLDVQVYDTTNKATFGYATLGVFDNHDPEGDLSNTQPQPPVTGGC